MGWYIGLRFSLKLKYYSSSTYACICSILKAIPFVGVNSEVKGKAFGIAVTPYHSVVFWFS